LKVHLADRPFPQPLGPRRLRQVWDRQARWARLRRMTFPRLFALEILTSGLIPMVCAAVLADAFETSPAVAVLATAGLWYAAEMALAFASGWRLSWKTPAALLARDVLLPVIWLQAWFIDSFDWRGNHISEEEPVSQR
jgi:ceramide glucosyltransferase